MGAGVCGVSAVGEKSGELEVDLEGGGLVGAVGGGEIFAKEAIGEVGGAMEVGEDGGGVDEDGAAGEVARPDWMAATASSGWLRRW